MERGESKEINKFSPEQLESLNKITNNFYKKNSIKEIQYTPSQLSELTQIAREQIIDKIDFNHKFKTAYKTIEEYDEY